MKPLNQISYNHGWVLAILFTLAFSACKKSIDVPANTNDQSLSAKAETWTPAANQNLAGYGPGGTPGQYCRP